jgi:[ribosomal protein S5]-alanine N-acetyltransferase
LLIRFALETVRLAMLPMCAADVDAIGRIANEPGVRRYLFDDRPIAPEFIRAVLAQSVSDFEARRFGIWTVREKGADSPIGFCGLRLVQDLGEVEILYALTESKWRHGYAFEAASSIVHYAFELAGLSEIVGMTDGPNIWSWWILEKLGMREFRPPDARPHLRYARLTRRKLVED